MHEEKQILQRELKECSRALEENLAALETSVSEKYKTTKEKVESIVEDISETAKTFSPSHQIDKHPWVFISGTVAGGFLIGSAIKNQFLTPPKTFFKAVNPAIKTVESPSKTSVFVKNLVESFKPELTIAKDTLLTFATQWIMDSARKKYSQHEDKLNELEQLFKSRFSNTQKREVANEPNRY